jgi:predicted transcriptional regulator
MTLAEVQRVLDAELLWADDLSTKVEAFCAADLMSDVLAMSRPGMLLLTGLANRQAVHTAAIVDLAAVVFVRGRRPDDGIISLAREKGIPLMRTARTMFEACGLLYAAVERRGR